MQEPGRIFSRNEIINRALGYNFDGFYRAVDTHVSCLRRKMEDSSAGSARLIETVYGSGYRCVTPRAPDLRSLSLPGLFSSLQFGCRWDSP